MREIYFIMLVLITQENYFNKRCVGYLKVKVSNIGLGYIVAVACLRQKNYRDLKWLGVTITNEVICFIHSGRTVICTYADRKRDKPRCAINRK